MSDDGDLTLLQRWHKFRDEVAFLHIFRRYDKALLVAAGRLLGDQSLAEDAVQETWLRFEKSQPREEFPTLRAFLLSILVHICSDIRSRASRRHELQKEADEVVDALERSKVQASWEDAGVRLNRCVQQLPDKMRTVIELRYVQCLGVADVAQRLGVSAGLVSKRAGRALQLLRKCMREYEGDPKK